MTLLYDLRQNSTKWKSREVDLAEQFKSVVEYIMRIFRSGPKIPCASDPNSVHTTGIVNATQVYVYKM